MFDRVFREIEMVKEITLQDIVELWNDGLLEMSKRRCLNVQVSSQVSSELGGGKNPKDNIPVQSEKDILVMHDALDEWKIPPLPPHTELETLGLQDLYGAEI